MIHHHPERPVSIYFFAPDHSRPDTNHPQPYSSQPLMRTGKNRLATEEANAFPLPRIQTGRPR
ncbi:hypothetical protein GE21DRAFT_1286536, partial [Neurospora crassa]